MWVKTLFLVILGVLQVFMAEAAWVVNDGEIVRKENTAYLAPQEHYRKGKQALDQKLWEEAVKHLHIVACSYSDTSFGQDAHFYLGIAYYNLLDYDLSNNAVNDYLNCQSNPRFFEEAIEYKYCIAEKFRRGARRHYFNSRHMPMWASGKSQALEIYDEVIAAMPNHELAAKALFSKACLQWQLNDYRDSIDSFQAVIRRFPKNELAPESYLRITKVYIDQAKKEFQNPDILAFAHINLSKFESDFPREEKLELARQDVLCLKEIYAKGLYDIAQFYERVDQPRASVIYYQKALFEYPETQTAQRSRRRLVRLCPTALDIEPRERDEIQEMPGVPDEIEFVEMLKKEQDTEQYADILEEESAA